MNIYNMVSKT